MSSLFPAFLLIAAFFGIFSHSKHSRPSPQPCSRSCFDLLIMMRVWCKNYPQFSLFQGRVPTPSHPLKSDTGRRWTETPWRHRSYRSWKHTSQARTTTSMLWLMSSHIEAVNASTPIVSVFRPLRPTTRMHSWTLIASLDQNALSGTCEDHSP